MICIELSWLTTGELIQTGSCSQPGQVSGIFLPRIASFIFVGINLQNKLVARRIRYFVVESLLMLFALSANCFKTIRTNLRD